MRGLRVSAAIAVAGALAILAVSAAPAGAQRTIFKGQFQCDDRGLVSPLAGMNVELWKRGDSFWPVEWVGRRVDQGYTAADGSFSMRTPEDEDNYFVRMALRDAHGVHLRDFWGINDWSVDTAQRRNNVRTRDFGGIVFSTEGKSHKCAVWSSVHHAYERFRAETGTELPTRGVEIQADAVNFGVPYTPGTSMLWASDYPVGHGDPPDDATVRHEFAHVIRHGLDGDFGHFVGDAATFNYAQHHGACDHTNSGFAFNEGWAEFWAQRFWPAPDCGRPNDYETEGNVAAALTELMENCAGGQRKIMVDTLRNNPLRIHSYEEFRAALGCPIPKYSPVLVIAATAEPPPPPPTPPTVNAKIAHQEVRFASRQIRRLGKRLKVSLRKAKNPPPCLRDPCKATLKKVTLPAVLKFQLQMAKMQRGTAARFDSGKEQGKYAGQSIGQLLKGQAKRDAEVRKKIVRASLARIREALKAARPVFRIDSSKATRRLRRVLAKAAARFRRAKRKAARALPGSLVRTPMNFRLPKRRLPRIPVPPPIPEPGPVLDLRASSSLTLDKCPVAVTEGKPIEVGGTLTPAVDGSPVTVSFSHPAYGTVTKVAGTDPAGKWSAEYEPPQGQTGTWSVNASFGGDANRRAAVSPTCQTEYGPFV